MHIENAFTSPIIVDQLDNIDNNELIKYANLLKSQSAGRVKSNYLGWQSNDLDNSNPEIQKLANEILARISYLHAEFGFKTASDIFLTNIWININSHGSFNRPHIHQDSIFSGAYYVSTDGLDGDIHFIHPAKTHQYHIKEDTVDKFTNFTSSSYRTKPAVGKLVLFPSWLEHYVEPNVSNHDRISISFNSNFSI